MCVYIYTHTNLNTPNTTYSVKKDTNKKDGSSSIHTLNLMYSPQMGPAPDETEECLLNSYCVPDPRAKIPPFLDPLFSQSPKSKNGGRGLKVTPRLHIQLMFNSTQRQKANTELGAPATE